MAFFSKFSHDGYLMIDHRASPGIPADQAQKLGYDPSLVGEGKVFEAPTLGCPHCGASVVLNPQRVRDRAHCFQCNMYICDWCDAARREPDYVHRTFRQIADLVQDGKVTLAGTASHPLLIPK